jgi:hypothetical protein
MPLPLPRPPIEVFQLTDPVAPGFAQELDAIKSPPPGGGSTPAATYPFDVSFSGSANPRDTLVQPGTINGVLPTNYDTVFSLAAVGVYYLVLTVTALDGEIASAVLSMDASPPAGVPTILGQPPTSFAYLLGVIVDLVWYRTIGPGSLAAAGAEVFRVSKTSPSPGTLPYDIYYTWNVTAV